MDDSSQNRKSIASGTISINKKNPNPATLSRTVSSASTKKEPPKPKLSTTTSKTPPPLPTQYSNQAPPPTPFPSAYPPTQPNMGYNDPYANDWNTPPSNQWGPSSYQQPMGQTNLTMEQKVEVIKNIFKEVLGRDATDKDINYYKYGIVTEDSLRKKLTIGKEHTDLIKNGNAYKSTKEAYDELLLKVRQYEAKIKDHIEEFKKMKIVFDEKNRYIQYLRTKIKEYPDYSTESAYGISSINPLPAQTPTNNLQPIGSSANEQSNVIPTSKSSSGLFTQSLKDFLKSLFDF